MYNYMYLYHENCFKLYRGGEWEVPLTILGQSIDFPTVILRCLYESFRLISGEVHFPLKQFNSLNITILSFDSNNLWVPDRLAGWLAGWISYFVTHYNSWQASSPTLSYEVCFVGRNPQFQYRVQKTPPLFCILNQTNLIYDLWTSVRSVLMFYNRDLDPPGGLLP